MNGRAAGGRQIGSRLLAGMIMLVAGPIVFVSAMVALTNTTCVPFNLRFAGWRLLGLSFAATAMLLALMRRPRSHTAGSIVVLTVAVIECFGFALFSLDLALCAPTAS
jgi:hypothetical protein